MLKESLNTAYLHYNQAKDYYDELKLIDINVNNFRDKKQIMIIDAFIFRFLKLQDFMGNKLFKDLLISIGLYESNMSLLDVVDKLEKIELIDSADKWMEFRQVRNKLTHEYPENENDIIEGIDMALKVFKNIGDILINIDNYIKQKSLIVIKK